MTPENITLYFSSTIRQTPERGSWCARGLYLDLPVTSAKLPLDQSLNHTICDVYTPKAAEINFNTREMLRILFLFIVCDIHFFGFIEALDSKGVLWRQKKVLRKPHNALA